MPGTTRPTMHDIGAAQNEPRNLRLQMAKAHYYDIAKRCHFLGSGIAIALALVSPVVLVTKPDLGPLLGAVAGSWIFLSRLVMDPVTKANQQRGATAQEMFDCNVLGLAWNPTLTEKLLDENIHSLSRRVDDESKVARHRDWYPATAEVDWPCSVAICQRANIVWARRQHSAYGWFLMLAAGVWLIFGVALSIGENATLAQYLTTIALPSLPAVLDSIELFKRHSDAASKRRALEPDINANCDNAAVTTDTLREVQDQIFELRRTDPMVAGWFYHIVRSNYEADMRYAAQARSKDG